MRSTSVRELHIHTSALVQDASEGAVIVIERRGQPVAELRPLSQAAGLSAEAKRKIFTRMEKFWARQGTVQTDSTRMIEEDRNR